MFFTFLRKVINVFFYLFVKDINVFFFTFSEVRVMLLRGAAALRNKVEDEVQVPTRSLQGHLGHHRRHCHHDQ